MLCPTSRWGPSSEVTPVVLLWLGRRFLGVDQRRAMAALMRSCCRASMEWSESVLGACSMTEPPRYDACRCCGSRVTSDLPGPAGPGTCCVLGLSGPVPGTLRGGKIWAGMR